MLWDICCDMQPNRKCSLLQDFLFQYFCSPKKIEWSAIKRAELFNKSSCKHQETKAEIFIWGVFRSFDFKPAYSKNKTSVRTGHKLRALFLTAFCRFLQALLNCCSFTRIPLSSASHLDWKHDHRAEPMHSIPVENEHTHTQSAALTHKPMFDLLHAQILTVTFTQTKKNANPALFFFAPSSKCTHKYARL